MQIRYTGSPRGLASLVSDLEGAGLTTSYTPPEESRGTGITAIEVVIYIGGAVVLGAANKAGSDAYDAVARRVVAKWRERKLGDADIEGDEQVDLVAGSE